MESSENRSQLSKRARQRDNLSELAQGPPAAPRRANTAEAKPSRVWGPTLGQQELC